jgi:hypothetical protein
MYWTSRISFDLFFGLTAFVHLVFVVKYWLLSRKLMGQDAERCAQIWFYSLTLMIVGTAIADLIVTWSDYDLLGGNYSYKAVLSVTVLFFVPEILTIYLLFDALSTIKQRSEMAISTKQVFLQSMAMVCFVAGNLVTGILIFIHETPCGVFFVCMCLTVALNGVSGYTFTKTLVHIA